MHQNFFYSALIVLLLGGALPAAAQKKARQAKTASAKKDVKFLDEITIETPAAPADPKAVFSESLFTAKKTEAPTAAAAVSIEKATSLQIKYALLMDTEVEAQDDAGLLEVLDQWLGTQYKFGGTDKSGIDCSALMQTLFTSLYGIALPRTAREQYDFSRRISRTEIREGDLIFFNTVGGVSHVGMYLQNNKFVHAASGGVTISDMYEDYWMRKFVGIGRVDNGQSVAIH